MCIIALKPAGVKMPSEEGIRHMFEKNPDGAGYAIQGDIRHNGGFGVEYKKGFMNVESLLKALEDKGDLTDFTVAIHCRIKTSGKVDPATCHPFPMSNQYADLKKTEGEGTVLFHNGVITGLGGFIDPNSSDTQDYVVGVGMRYLNKAKMPSKLNQKLIGTITGSSRILVMYPNRSFPTIRFGTWYEQDGIYYSNTGYLHNKVEKEERDYYQRHAGYGYYYRGHYYDDYYDYYDDYKLMQQSQVTEEDLDDYLFDEGFYESEQGDFLQFDDDELFMEWYDKADAVGNEDNMVKYNNKIWYIDFVELCAYTDSALERLFDKNAVSRVRKNLIKGGWIKNAY